VHPLWRDDIDEWPQTAATAFAHAELKRTIQSREFVGKVGEALF
jgi:hypothetical protein